MSQICLNSLTHSEQYELNLTWASSLMGGSHSEQYWWIPYKAHLFKGQVSHRFEDDLCWPASPIKTWQSSRNWVSVCAHSKHRLAIAKTLSAPQVYMCMTHTYVQHCSASHTGLQKYVLQWLLQCPSCSSQMACHLVGAWMLKLMSSNHGTKYGNQQHARWSNQQVDPYDSLPMLCLGPIFL